MFDPPEQPYQPTPNSGSRLTLLLLLLLVVVALFAHNRRPEPALQLVMDGPPPVEAPVGKLAVVFEERRPASVRIEARSPNPFLRNSPLGIGTGFFIDENGLLMTAYHVVDPSNPSGGAEPIYVAVTPEGDEYELELVGFDAYLDLALLKAKLADGEHVPFIPLAERQPQVGSQVVAIGNSRGDFLEGRSGRVTRLGVHAARADFANDTIELTASLAPGDSGGPVLNERGEVVGVVSYISFSPDDMSAESESFVPPFLRGLALPRDFASYAVPVTRTSETVAALLAGEQRDVPVIGFSWNGFDYQPGAASGVNLGPKPGPVIGRVQPGGPADKAGLRSYNEKPVYNDGGRLIGTVVEADVIVAVDGEPTPGFFELLEVIRRKQIGQPVTLTVQRGRQTLEIELVLGAKRAVFN